MLRSSFAFAALFTLACSTHRVDECFPPCGPSDQTFFAHCVASGLPGECLAGNRRCCALAAECIGALDDQTVETTRTDCMTLAEDQCYPPCDANDESLYELCLGMGSAVCMIGDDECCALDSDCIGMLGDFVITADGCCGNATDCASGELCDSEFTCAPGPGCGDGVTTAPETCDDGNQITEELCAYGPMSCVVCTSSCVEQPGVARFCGDGNVDSDAGEECDPPDVELCDPSCHHIGLDPCFDGTMDGMETDMDCGGPDCGPCDVGAMCLVATDCTTASALCGATAFCGPMSLCEERGGCDDMNVCTHDFCLGTSGCSSSPIDEDGDGAGPLDLGCGRDCDDTDPNIGPAALEECDGIDNNCNDLIDETC
jgi:hypothetical protein